jgi:carbonic anhydrase
MDSRAPIESYLDGGKIRLTGAMYDVATGKVTYLEP